MSQAATSQPQTVALPETYPLVSAAELLALVTGGTSANTTGAGNTQASELASTADIHILDCRFELANPDKGRSDFDAGHIPGARYVHIDHDLCAEKTGQNGRHPLPDFFEFVLRTQQWGLKKDNLIIAMDAGNAMVAGRLWWMLRWAGYPKAKVLNGGWAAWLAVGGPRTSSQAVSGSNSQEASQTHSPTTSREASPVQTHAAGNSTDDLPAGAQSTLPRHAPAMQTVDAAAVVQNLQDRQFHIIDGRDRERFTGARDTMDPVAGHIPGARNRCFLDNLNADGTFKSPEQLKTEYAALLGEQAPQDIVHSCGSGVTACHNLLAMEAAGLQGSRLYPGSWSEYCADPTRPVQRGD